LIQSDIIEGCKFSSENNGSEDNILALCNRAYVSGDFAFSFAPDYKFTATKDYVITGIKTRILNPEGPHSSGGEEGRTTFSAGAVGFRIVCLPLFCFLSPQNK